MVSRDTYIYETSAQTEKSPFHPLAMVGTWVPLQTLETICTLPTILTKNAVQRTRVLSISVGDRHYMLSPDSTKWKRCLLGPTPLHSTFWKSFFIQELTKKKMVSNQSVHFSLSPFNVRHGLRKYHAMVTLQKSKRNSKLLSRWEKADRFMRCHILTLIFYCFPPPSLHSVSITRKVLLSCSEHSRKSKALKSHWNMSVPVVRFVLIF